MDVQNVFLSTTTSGTKMLRYRTEITDADAGGISLDALLCKKPIEDNPKISPSYNLPA
jgi:hypothetical protein